MLNAGARIEGSADARFRAAGAELAGTAGIEVDLGSGRVAIGERTLWLRPRSDPDTYALADGRPVRLPGFDERNQCVFAALRCADPRQCLLQNLRAVVLSDALDDELDNALVLALAGGAVPAPPFGACATAADGVRPALLVDLEAAERPAENQAGWRRLAFAPTSLADLVDEMVQRLLDRANPGITESAATSDLSAHVGGVVLRPVPTATEAAPAAAPTGRRHSPDRRTATGPRDDGESAPDRQRRSPAGSRRILAPRQERAPSVGTLSPGAAAVIPSTVFGTRAGTADTARRMSPADEIASAADRAMPYAATPTPGRAVATEAPTRDPATPLRARWTLRPADRAAPATDYPFSATADAAASVAAPFAAGPAVSQPALPPPATAAERLPIAAPEALAEVAQALADECDLRGLAA